jgi:nucleotide-binding universal stress UspA family protein
VRLGVAIATAVAALHAQEVIHLDLKPGNVLLRPGGEAVLIDFGLARHGHFPDLLAEEFRRPIGSAAYISPEQVLGVRDDPRSDLFALGVMLYELATGTLPFGSPRGGALRRRLYRDPVPPRALVPLLSPALQEVILRCLEPDPNVRHASAAQLAFDLGNLAAVAVGERGLRTHRAPPLTVFARWIRAAGLEPPPAARAVPRLVGSGIVLVAVATAHTDEGQQEALRRTVKRIVGGDRTRVACVTVVPPSSELGGHRDDQTAPGQRIKQLRLLREWAEPMELGEGQLTYHVLESDRPAEALIEYVRANGVEHVVLGPPPRGVSLLGLLGAVATKVAVEAPCTVTIARPERGT